MPNATQLASANETENDFRSHHFTPLDSPIEIEVSVCLGVGSCAPKRSFASGEKLKIRAVLDFAKRATSETQHTRQRVLSMLIRSEVRNLSGEAVARCYSTAYGVDFDQT